MRTLSTTKKGDAPIRITVSIGVASWPQADSAQALVAAAAMYAAKQGGRNRVSGGA